jgi:hypothetical protein
MLSTMVKRKATIYHLIYSYISNHSNDNCGDCCSNSSSNSNSSKNRADNSNKSVSDSMVKIFDSLKIHLQNRYVYVYDS